MLSVEDYVSFIQVCHGNRRHDLAHTFTISCIVALPGWCYDGKKHMPHEAVSLRTNKWRGQFY